MKPGAGFTFAVVNFGYGVMYWCRTTAVLHSASFAFWLLPELHHRWNGFGFIITVHIFKRAFMYLLMSSAIAAPSISTQMFIKKCLPSILCTSFHSLFPIYELELIVKGSSSSLAVSALCWFMQSENLLCIFKPVTLSGAQDDHHVLVTCACWKQWKSSWETRGMPGPAQSIISKHFVFRPLQAQMVIGKRVKTVGM